MTAVILHGYTLPQFWLPALAFLVAGIFIGLWMQRRFG